ncbi:MAG: DUF4115 domain-containing protein [Candidatus Omnitrophota bacterium]|nr:DUF4115 domain-containing protein [Candidatus Omnitrophota bacterium]
MYKGESREMESIGGRLKKIRLEKNITLEEAQKKTKISINILRAIEGDGLTSLSPVYLKGFIKIYSEFLGFDPLGHISERREPQSAGKSQEGSGSESKKILATSETKNKDKENTLFLRSAKVKSWLVIPFNKIKTYFIFILIIAIGASSLFILGKFMLSKGIKQLACIKKVVLRETKIKDNRHLSQSQFLIKQTVQGTSKIKTQIASPAKEAASGIRLGIRAKENCWISLKVDGKVVFHRTLEKGRYENWQAKDKMELSVGNAMAIELEVNGQIFSKLGKRNQQLKNILITKEGLSIK